VLVVAKGYEPTFFEKVDPVTGPLEAPLQRFERPGLQPNAQLLGRVVDSEGRPIEGAVVSPQGVERGEGTTWGGLRGIDPLAVTDARGEFLITADKPFDALALKVEARLFARRTFLHVASGDTRHDLKVTEGASVVGRVLKDGRPLGGVAIGLVSVQRNVEVFTGEYVIGTMDDGAFLFVNVPPEMEYHVYGEMDSLAPHGAIPSTKLRTRGDGTTADAGELRVRPGHRLAGRVKFSDGGHIPEHTRVLVSREEAWDSTFMKLDAQGRFAFTNVPAEKLNVSVRVPRYRLAAANGSLDSYNPFRLVGKLTGDKTNLTILLEPGDHLPSDFTSLPENERPENLPLLGIEEKRKLADTWTLTGRAVDAETGEPLTNFRLTVGRRQFPQSPWTDWQRARATEHTGGTFALELSKQGGTVLLLAEAEGRLPEVSEPFEPGRATIDFRLRKGSGPKGLLLLPDGSPAAGVTVLYLGPGEQAGLSREGRFSGSRLPGGSQALTDPNGRFDFKPKFGECELYAASDAGFARVSPRDLAKNGNVTLQPWARVRGRLVRGGQPLPGERIDLGWPAGFRAESGWLHLHGSKSDADGYFTLEHVPPAELILTTRRQSGFGGWTNERQHLFTVKPGETLDLGTIEKKDAPTASK
jgi:hypothetical protein